ncbi:tetratricopeptide repeat protein [Tabrizicola sp.]|uniref:tetratricopeptide repeat protein n=1 Tax=Tabrizicola sp. TaxID=2005166 RepID=UPI003F2FE6CB
MHRSALLAFLCASILAACGNTGGPDRNVPYGADASGEGVDGLLVGHRLMAAGESELALKAYLRAAAEQGMNVDVLSAIGSANLALGRLGQAEQILRRAMDEDPTFVPAINNLGVVLMERGQFGEARVVFQQAFAIDSGQSDSIRENLRLAIARTEGVVYSDSEEEPTMSLVRRGQGQYELLTEL